jgi:hypothetical protein
LTGSRGSRQQRAELAERAPEAFDAAWAEIATNLGEDPIDIELARKRTIALLSVASDCFAENALD